MCWAQTRLSLTVLFESVILSFSYSFEFPWKEIRQAIVDCVWKGLRARESEDFASEDKLAMKKNTSGSNMKW